MFSSTTLATIAALAAAIPVLGHIEMTNPPPWNSKHNPNTPSANIDYSMTSPLDASGSNYPCKGYNSVLGTAAGNSVASWAPGSSQSIQLAGTAIHGGGSCQLSLSYDGGRTFKVIQSILGECPSIGSWNFDVPNDAPAGDAVFAWTWFNNLGNREMYMNCASVTIGGGGQRRRDDESYSNATLVSRAASYNSAPEIFQANIGNGCGTAETYDVDFPNPGSNVIRRSSFRPHAPTGNCAGGGGSGSGSGSGSNPAPAESSASASSESSAPSAPASPVPSPSSTASSATFDDGQWRPDSTAAPAPTISTPDLGNWHNDGSASASASSSSAAPEATPSKSKCNRKRRVRRHKKRLNHGQGTF
ncbi:hypothetical protein CC85DRAFT_287531 [Cutaneotrichosporon oleaginosum]|uniref:Endoglucanase n=1 Tax=Cutaneotrichosporon oleaginosum TaxID=879819 RepID=A0A0J0XH58_9TREE|nr:uncharacterized protein CC85DRAFT_287531 [Cutaneotrichosporon oleaginosum]KLT40426.1 hypothetical protein CC85DRAFT_287531 [Cutaneotrichosporon oleaginosum]TXT11391.1 hypothetical protein COLE_01801 [Cutaneotrichosporon oleaginosum]